MHGLVALQALLDKLHDVVGQLVRPFGAPLPGQQTGQALAGEGRLGEIQGRARHAKQGGGIGLGGAIDTDMAQHFVFRLEQVVGIEKVARPKPRRQHTLGFGVEYTQATQAFEFRIQFRHIGNLCELYVI